MYIDKQLLAAGIVKDYRFRNRDCLDFFIYKLQHDGKDFCILDMTDCDDESVLVRVVIQYNHCPLIDLEYGEAE